ncbi:hypothetical protein [Hoeflea alexandrii]|uniref:hypothetical protein n=1 Tax=Hoeflea alexandrii TaxID=288436 RepID=UPI0022AF6D65|nr:hypothetical protein [Hoeflea alexandrii]MCZ4289651.1 hypothetical protein [Hoeflea alexandrii]
MKTTILSAVSVLVLLLSSQANSATINNFQCQKLYDKWQGLKGHKAFYITQDGQHCGYSYEDKTKSEAKEEALYYCNKNKSKGKCVLFKVK